MSKQRVSRNAKVVSVSIITSAALVAGGMAYASGETFTACVNKKNGLTRIISGKMKCYKSERQVTWNQTGPSGAQGATGATGPQGPAGTADGAGDVYTKKETSISLALDETKTILSMRLPAGTYSFTASGGAAFYTNNVILLKPRYMACLISKSTNTSGSDVLYPIEGMPSRTRLSFEPVSPDNQYDKEFGMKSFSWTTILDFTSETSVYLICTHEKSATDGSTDPFELIVRNTTFVATKTNQITFVGS